MKPTTIDEQTLSTVFGGADVKGKVETPAFKAEGEISTKETPERRNDFLTCMNDRQDRCGWVQSPQSCQDMAERACKGFIGSPNNPQKQ